MEIYEKPSVEIEEYEAMCDILTVSNGTNNNSLENVDDYNMIP